MNAGNERPPAGDRGAETSFGGDTHDVSPQWTATDEGAATLLDLVADVDHPSVAFEWRLFVSVLAQVSLEAGGQVDPNVVRPRIRERIAPKRIGSFYRRAALENLIRPDGWTVSDDVAGRNGGRPARVYRWIGGVR